MSGEFLGESENSVHKGRIIIPATFKARFSVESNQTVVMTLTEDLSIAIYPLDCWAMVKEKLINGDERQKKVLTLLKRFASEQQLEGPGRVKLSDFMLEKANITDKVMMRGEGDHITVWNPERYIMERDKDLDDLGKICRAEDRSVN